MFTLSIWCRVQDRPPFNQLAGRLKKIKDGGRERTWSTESMGLKHRTQSVGSDARSSEPEPEPEIQVVAAQPRASNGGSAAPVVSARLLRLPLGGYFLL